MFEVLTAVTFAEQVPDETNDARVRHKDDPQAAPYLAGMEQGWTESLERLTGYVATQVKE